MVFQDQADCKVKGLADGLRGGRGEDRPVDHASRLREQGQLKRREQELEVLAQMIQLASEQHDTKSRWAFTSTFYDAKVTELRRRLMEKSRLDKEHSEAQQTLSEHEKVKHRLQAEHRALELEGQEEETLLSEQLTYYRADVEELNLHVISAEQRHRAAVEDFRKRVATLEEERDSLERRLFRADECGRAVAKSHLCKQTQPPDKVLGDGMFQGMTDQDPPGNSSGDVELSSSNLVAASRTMKDCLHRSPSTSSSQDTNTGTGSRQIVAGTALPSRQSTFGTPVGSLCSTQARLSHSPCTPRMFKYPQHPVTPRTASPRPTAVRTSTPHRGRSFHMPLQRTCASMPKLDTSAKVSSSGIGPVVLNMPQNTTTHQLASPRVSGQSKMATASAPELLPKVHARPMSQCSLPTTTPKPFTVRPPDTSRRDSPLPQPLPSWRPESSPMVPFQTGNRSVSRTKSFGRHWHGDSPLPPQPSLQHMESAPTKPLSSRGRARSCSMTPPFASMKSESPLRTIVPVWRNEPVRMSIENSLSHGRTYSCSREPSETRQRHTSSKPMLSVKIQVDSPMPWSAGPHVGNFQNMWAGDVTPRARGHPSNVLSSSSRLSSGMPVVAPMNSLR